MNFRKELTMMWLNKLDHMSDKGLKIISHHRHRLRYINLPEDARH